MKRLVNFILILSLLFFISMKKERPAYVIHSKNGKIISYGEMVEGLKNADIIFFGELHGISIVHWLQFELTRDLYEIKKGKMVLGAEMLESDNQLVLDEYLQGLIPKSKFIKNARLWDNHSTDYQPLVDFAKKKKVPFIATNVPRRYAYIVFTRGFGGLNKISEKAKSYIAPLPIEFNADLKSYKKIEQHIGIKKSFHPGGNLAEAQALKDATMAYFIYKNYKKGEIFLHINGVYHSDDYEGIIWYLRRIDRKLNIKNITAVSKKKIEMFEGNDAGKADFFIYIPDTMSGN